MEPAEQLQGYTVTVERAEKAREISSVLDVLEHLTDKYSFQPEHLTSGKKDPNLTIEHMAGKVETFEKPHSLLLPSIRDQLTGRTKPMIQSTSTTDDNNQRNTNRALIPEVAKFAIPLIKLARILIKKTSGKIFKKQQSILGTTLELNSETMSQVYETPQLIFGLKPLANLLCIHYDHPTVENQAKICDTVEKIPKEMESTLTVLHSCLIPFLAQIEDQGSPKTQLESFLPILRQSWDTASDHLMDVILSFEVEQIAI
ncbi:hypothetical protein PtB15_12B26 [Puccinia triticina]|nr:hypothetical protein PtB15_12B26 [Puccinia triticina]